MSERVYHRRTQIVPKHWRKLDWASPANAPLCAWCDRQSTWRLVSLGGMSSAACDDHARFVEVARSTSPGASDA